MAEDKSLTIERTFDVPREVAWKAWTVPEHFASWYGKPGNVPLESVEMDIREGGRWKSTTVGPDGAQYNFSGRYREVAAPEKLVFTIEDPENPSDPDFELVTVVFQDSNGQTKMTFKQEGNLPPEEYQKGLKDGWGGFFDHLEKHLSRVRDV